MPGEVRGENLAAALASAYANNPTLQAERARQRATDEQVPQALSGWRPTVTASADTGWERFSYTPGTSTTDYSHPSDISIGLKQPIFRGLRTISDTKRAKATIDAGRQNLLIVEQQVLLDAITAYMGVVRDREIVQQRFHSQNLLAEEWKATQSRFKAGEITKTDVALAQARWSQAKADLSSAKATLAASTADYIRAIGHAPDVVVAPRSFQGLPRSLEEAQQIASRTNPEVLSALHIEEASRYNVDLVQGQLLPEVSLQASYEKSWEPDTGINSSNTAFVGGTVTVPLYESGAVYSQVREAKQIASQRRLQIIESERLIRDRVATAWTTLDAARAAAAAIGDQVAANEVALKGVQEEQRVGAGPLIRVLDTERDLVESMVALSQTTHDGIVAAYQLLASIGRLTADGLNLPVLHYDPSANYEAVKNKWIGTSADTIE